MSFTIGPEKKSNKKKKQTSRVYYPGLISPNISTNTVWLAGCLHENHRLIKSKEIDSKKKTKSPYESIQKTKFRPLRQAIRSSPLDHLLIISRNEIESCIVIQSAWRRVQSIHKLHELGQQKLAAVLIQAIIRGSLKRLWYKKWIHKVILFATKCQARRRQILVSNTLTKQFFVERNAAITIQKMIRTFNARCFLYSARETKCAIRIQAAWRAFREDRFSSASLFNSFATKIQSQVRRVRAEQDVSEIRTEKTTLSLIIQRFWRGFAARRKVDQVLLDRNNELYRRHILVVTTEIDQMKKSLDFLNEEQGKKKSNELQLWSAQIEESRILVKNGERNLRELLMTKNQITPELVSQGWEDEIQNKIKNERQSLTTHKLDLVMNLSCNYEILRESFDTFRIKRTDLERKVTQLEDEKQKLTAIVQRENRHITKRMDLKSKRMAIADEKRKWKVVSRHPNGKPVKYKDLFEMHSIPTYSFCSGNVNLFPENSSSNIDLFADKVELQSYLSEINLFDSITNPVTRFM